MPSQGVTRQRGPNRVFSKIKQKGPIFQAESGPESGHFPPEISGKQAARGREKTRKHEIF